MLKVIEYENSLNASAKIAIVMSQFNSFVVDRLYEAAISTLTAADVPENSITVVKVPGAFEIPTAVKALLETSKYDAIITLGAVIRGETPHFDFICNECARGIAQLSIDFSKPVIFGVLTVDNSEQALDRAGDEESNKGAESALAALEMISITKQIHD